MNILLTSLNAKFIHSSLSIHSLKAFAKEYKDNITIEEYTINNDEDFIISSIYEKIPDIIGFSCYILNIEETLNICSTLKKILPNITIILGGPEVSYDPIKFLKYSYIDIVVIGEGEVAFYEIIKNMTNGLPLDNIQGMAYKNNGEININNDVIKVDLDKIPFVYNELSIFENKIIYYESSRGCPYNCQYCLSSVEAGVRFLNIDRVYSDLAFFINNNVKQVKFVDRTFNAKKKHSLDIWKFLIDNDNGVTNFHFEISGDIIDDEMIELLKTARVGLFQFEIGVQSTNSTTLKEIKRYATKEKLFENIKKIKELGNIHMHLDLIAGLPYEDFTTFGKSFNEVYALEPEQFQLGFLKLLRGSGLRENKDMYGIKFRDKAPYEVLSTNDLTFNDILNLKGIEEMLEKFYNSGHFTTTIKYFETLYKDPFQLYFNMWKFFKERKYNLLSHKKIFFYEFLLEFGEESKSDIVKNLIRFDMYSLENVKNLPENLSYNKSLDIKWNWNNTYEDLKIFGNHYNIGITKRQIIRNTHIDYFSIDITKFLKEGKVVKKPIILLFDYYNLVDGIQRNKVTYLEMESRNNYEQKN